MGESVGKAVGNHRDLIAWQKGMDLAQLTYTVTRSFPDEERFGLVSQMRRAAVSVPANIAEGFGRRQKKEFRRFLEIALGSLFELETHAELARRMGLLAGPACGRYRKAIQAADAVLGGLLRSQRG